MGGIVVGDLHDYVEDFCHIFNPAPAASGSVHALRTCLMYSATVISRGKHMYCARRYLMPVYRRGEHCIARDAVVRGGRPEQTCHMVQAARPSQAQSISGARCA